MKKIYKYKLVPNAFFVTKIEMPLGRKPISVGEQNDELFVWAEIDESEEVSMEAVFYVIPTGYKELPEGDLIFIGTVQMSCGLVWHIYWDNDWE